MIYYNKALPDCRNWPIFDTFLAGNRIDKSLDKPLKIVKKIDAAMGDRHEKERQEKITCLRLD